MFRKNDPYTYHETGILENSNNVQSGQIYSEYQVTHYDDVQLSSGCEQSVQPGSDGRKYVLACTQRIRIYNRNGLNVCPQAEIVSFDDYPALLNTSINISQSSGISLELLNVVPNTINTQVQSSGTSGTSTGETSSSSTSSTIGSSTSQTNSYNASVGWMQGFNCSVSKDKSNAQTQDSSATTGSEAGSSSGNESSESEAMSVKDWGGYCLLNPVTSCPEWTFGQEYPWDAINCRKTDGTENPDNTDQVRLVLPTAMQVRLYDGVSLYPPSHLSMFGIDFVMKAQWLISIPAAISDEITVKHIVNFFSASHKISDGEDQANVYLDATPTVLSVADPASLSHTLDLGILGLAPVGAGAPPALVGFLPGKFVVAPSSATDDAQPTPFRIFSAANNLRITDITTYPESCTAGTGFAASETELTATLGGNCAALTMRLLFKVVDTTQNYTLFLKHWKSGQNDVRLTITVNGDTANALTKYVDAVEAEGGEGNVLSIALRNLSVADVDYHDYLTLGLNAIDIAIAPVEGADSGVYQLRGVSIETE